MNARYDATVKNSEPTKNVTAVADDEQRADPPRQPAPFADLDRPTLSPGAPVPAAAVRKLIADLRDERPRPSGSNVGRCRRQPRRGSRGRQWLNDGVWLGSGLREHDSTAGGLRTSPRAASTNGEEITTALSTTPSSAWMTPDSLSWSGRVPRSRG
jgi:hypothetical protein